jgi:hypothetical protein
LFSKVAFTRTFTVSWIFFDNYHMITIHMFFQSCYTICLITCYKPPFFFVFGLRACTRPL